MAEPTGGARRPGNVVISVDAMGGDRGPATVIAGIAASAEKNPEIRFIVHGPEPELRRLIGRRKGLAERCDIRHAGGVVLRNASGPFRIAGHDLRYQMRIRKHEYEKHALFGCACRCTLRLPSHPSPPACANRANFPC